MAKFAAIYTYGDIAKRDATRPEHRVYLQGLLASGELWESGPFVDDKGALLVYEADSEAEARSMVDNDPYVKNGCLSDVVIREWNRLFHHDND